MNKEKDKLFSKFIAEFDPMGEIRQWLSYSQLQDQYYLWLNNRDNSFKENKYDKEKHEQSKQNEDSQVIIQCGICNIKIRLPYPFIKRNFRCRRCNTKYSIISPKEKLNVYVIQPIKIHNHDEQTYQKTQIPNEVKKALEVLGTKDKEIDFQTLKKLFRVRMQEYHPDKVAGLGIDLRLLAEEKTKALVAAYRIAEEYFKERL